MRHLVLVSILMFLLSCKSYRSETNLSGHTFPSPTRALAQQGTSLIKTLFLTQINSVNEFEQLAQESTGVIRQGQTIKVFIDNRKMQNPIVYFMNANYCPTDKCIEPPQEAVFHYNFAKKVLKGFAMTSEAYTQNAYYTTDLKDRQFFDARIQQFSLDVDGYKKVYYGVRFIERDLISNAMIQHAMDAISRAFNIPAHQMAFIRNSETQKIDDILAWLDSQNIANFTMERILSGVSYVGLNAGTAYGFVRMYPKSEEDLEPFDIPVFATLPIDLAVVAGTISTEYQDVGSHVNLKSKERGTPNMVVRDAGQIENLQRLDGRPVKLTVAFGEFSIEEVNADLVYADYQKKINKPWQQVIQSSEDKLIHFDEMCKSDQPAKCLEKSRTFGGKVAGLGFLAHPMVAGIGSPLQKKFKYRLSPMGFGIPLTYYNQFMRENLQRDDALKAIYEELINREMGIDGAKPLQSEERKQLVHQLKNKILQSEIPESIYKKFYAELQVLKKKVDAAYPGYSLDKLKVRSSSNAEDIVGFNGAGLHDSYSAQVSDSKESDFQNTNCKYVFEVDGDTGLEEEDVEPKSLACAIKGAYASLWNSRAIRERSFRRFDHRTASMGLSVQPSYKFRKGIKIKSNSVMITRVLGTESVFGQQLSTQVKNGLVTNPTPNTKSELAVISFDSTGKNFGINLLQYAKPIATEPALTKMILSREEMLQFSEIAREVEIQYCKSKKNYFPGQNCAFVINSQKKALALDMEFKQYDNKEILIKQVRTFSGR